MPGTLASGFQTSRSIAPSTTTASRSAAPPRATGTRCRRVATRRQRVPVALGGAALLLAVVVLGAIDLLVWNPLAKVPGTDLVTIYALMAER
ncbi:hypothetical protein NB037_18430, partial [Rathayibacter sp. ZW T2_19]|nr:hypothetical protein [Rathayibacter rubneri]